MVRRDARNVHSAVVEGRVFFVGLRSTRVEGKRQGTRGRWPTSREGTFYKHSTPTLVHESNAHRRKKNLEIDGFVDLFAR